MTAKLKRPQDGAALNGTPIEHLFPTDPETAKTLRGFGIDTVELCSRLTPHATDTIGMNSQHWVTSAKRYLERAKNDEYQPLWQAIESMSTSSGRS
jgi:hypothetical protein